MRNPSKSIWRRLIVGLAIGPSILAGAALATAMAIYPAAAAAVCPNCYGFERVAPHLFIERDADRALRANAENMVSQGRARVAAFYGGLSGSPRVLICTSEDCYRRVHGGRSKGMAFLRFALVLSPRGTTPVIAAHELSHIELHRRVGVVRILRQAVPQWFDEGVAVVVSDNPRYLAPLSAAIAAVSCPTGICRPTAPPGWKRRRMIKSMQKRLAASAAGWLRMAAQLRRSRCSAASAMAFHSKRPTRNRMPSRRKQTELTPVSRVAVRGRARGGGPAPADRRCGCDRRNRARSLPSAFWRRRSGIRRSSDRRAASGTWPLSAR